MRTTRLVSGSPWTKADRHIHSVVDAAVALHGETTGSGANNHSSDELTRLISWLEWRIADGWESKHGEWDSFDEMVRRLAMAALVEWRRR